MVGSKDVRMENSPLKVDLDFLQNEFQSGIYNTTGLLLKVYKESKI